jgi:hypothetical protein
MYKDETTRDKQDKNSRIESRQKMHRTCPRIHKFRLPWSTTLDRRVLNYVSIGDSASGKEEAADGKRVVRSCHGQQQTIRTCRCIQSQLPDVPATNIPRRWTIVPGTACTVYWCSVVQNCSTETKSRPFWPALNSLLNKLVHSLRQHGRKWDGRCKYYSPGHMLGPMNRHFDQ